MANLGPLPTEIVLDILEQLRLQCTDQPPSGLTSGPDYAPTTALAHLCLTCRSFRDLTEPILYQSPTSRSHGLARLVRTLAERPDLARQVVSLKLPGGDAVRELPTTIFARDAGFLEGIMAEFPQSDDVSAHWYLTRPPIGRVSGSTGQFHFRPLAALAALAITQTPNIVRLEIEMTPGIAFPFCHSASLPSLTELVVWSKSGNNTLGTLHHLLEAAPNLQSFRGDHLTVRASGVPYHDLKKVILEQSSLFEYSLASMVWGFTKLESFRYQSDGLVPSMDPTPRQISLHMLKVENSLRHLSLDLSKLHLNKKLPTEDALCSLKSFHVLETLEVDSTSIYLPRRRETRTDGSLLVELLPESIRRFTIQDPHQHIEQDILRLAQEARDKFPYLDMIRLTDASEYWTETREAIRSLGIECEILPRISQSIDRDSTDVS